ncbi:hypothetical protein DERP_011728 [Dermatophagoides pteronyssinus]|uniref:Uncharacterized protein n=1 Tax=Dermatophagoides pteronyssinus TaxID=6956 RepID=A0ABQ8J347_DERPT|nr:hypothetical protein DERP_011728 [Dermatophagoides pteronyssinus]
MDQQSSSSIENPIERELKNLILKAKKLIQNNADDDLPKDFDWIKQNIDSTEKLLKQIESIQQKNVSIIDTKLFNESRDCCEQLKNWSKLLLEHRKRIQNDDQKQMVQQLDQFSQQNTSFNITHYDWIEQNIQETAKLLKQIESLQQKNMAIIIHSYMSIIDTKLFNESRDCCEQLQNWSKLLLEHRKPAKTTTENPKMTTAKERIENEMKQLILKAKKLIAEEFDSCVDWIDDEKKKSKKLLEQLEKLQRQYPDIDGKIFNESRDCCDELRQFQKRLDEYRKSILNNDDRMVVNTLDELGRANEGFQRSRKILFYK